MEEGVGAPGSSGRGSRGAPFTDGRELAAMVQRDTAMPTRALVAFDDPQASSWNPVHADALAAGAQARRDMTHGGNPGGAGAGRAPALVAKR